MLWTSIRARQSGTCALASHKAAPFATVGSNYLDEGRSGRKNTAPAPSASKSPAARCLHCRAGTGRWLSRAEGADPRRTGLCQPVEGTYLAVDISGIAKKPEPPKQSAGTSTRSPAKPSGWARFRHRTKPQQGEGRRGIRSSFSVTPRQWNCGQSRWLHPQHQGLGFLRHIVAAG
jgi:hypothetical protein